MQICFFEDDLTTNFHPLTLSRPVDDLRIGILTIAEKWQHAFEGISTNRLTRSELKTLFEQQPIGDEPCLWINSRFFPSPSLLKEVRNLNEGTGIKTGDTLVAAQADASTTRQWLENGRPDANSLLVLEATSFPCIIHLWDLFLQNDGQIIADLELLNHPSSTRNTIASHAILENRPDIYIGHDVIIEPGAIIMAQKGPVYIGDGATIMAGAMIQGPAAICEKATVKMGAKIYHSTTIGPVCKVGGEVTNSIFHSYSNKGHDGFIGNSLLGQWCNIGADTNTSNLKNNYSNIRIPDWKSKKEVETGQQFMGTVMADHTKTAINTQLNTGTVCGISCNIFANDFPPKLISSFSWVGSNVIQPYKFDKAIETMQAMMERRNVELTEPYHELMQHIYKKEHR